MILFIKLDSGIHFANFSIDALGKIKGVKISKAAFDSSSTIHWVDVAVKDLPQKFTAYSPTEAITHAYIVGADGTLLQIAFKVSAAYRLPITVCRFLDDDWQRITDVRVKDVDVNENDYLALDATVKAALDGAYQKYLVANYSWEEQRRIELEDVFIIPADQTPLTTLQQRTISSVLKLYLSPLLLQSASKDEFTECLTAIILGTLTLEKKATWSITTQANCQPLRAILFPSNINTLATPQAFYAETKNAAAKAVTIADVQQYLYRVLAKKVHEIDQSSVIAIPASSPKLQVAMGQLTENVEMRLYAGLSPESYALLLKIYHLLKYSQPNMTNDFNQYFATLCCDDVIRIDILLNAIATRTFHDNEQQYLADELFAILLASGLECENSIQALTKKFFHVAIIVKVISSWESTANLQPTRTAIHFYLFLSMLSDRALDAHYTTLSVNELQRLLTALQRAAFGLRDDGMRKYLQLSAPWLMVPEKIERLKAIVNNCIWVRNRLAKLDPMLDPKELEAVCVLPAFSNHTTKLCILPIVLRDTKALNLCLKTQEEDILEYVYSVLFPLVPLVHGVRQDPTHLIANAAALWEILADLPEPIMLDFIFRIVFKLQNQNDIITTTDDLLQLITIIANKEKTQQLFTIAYRSQLEDIEDSLPTTFQALQAQILRLLKPFILSSVEIDILIAAIKDLTENESAIQKLEEYIYQFLIVALKSRLGDRALLKNEFVICANKAWQLIETYQTALNTKLFLKSKPKNSQTKLHDLASINLLNQLIPQFIVTITDLQHIFLHHNKRTIMAVVNILFPLRFSAKSNRSYRIEKFTPGKSLNNLIILIQALAANTNFQDSINTLFYTFPLIKYFKTLGDFRRLATIFENDMAMLTFLALLINPCYIFGNKSFSAMRKKVEFACEDYDLSFVQLKAAILDLYLPTHSPLFFQYQQATTARAIMRLSDDNTTSNQAHLIAIVQHDLLQMLKHKTGDTSLLNNDITMRILLYTQLIKRKESAPTLIQPMVIHRSIR